MATAKLTRFIECGKIINTHGCHGDVKVEPWTDTPRDLIDLGRIFVGEGETKKEMGNWGKPVPELFDAFPDCFEVDFVRVYDEV